MKSRDLVEDKFIGMYLLRKVYAREDADLLSRLNPALEIERVVEYWDGRIAVAFDGVSGIVSFEAEAFTPEDAKAVAASVLSHARALTNELSRQARRYTVSFAEFRGPACRAAAGRCSDGAAELPRQAERHRSGRHGPDRA